MGNYTIGGIYGAAIGSYLGAIVNFVLCYCIILIPIKIYEKISKKIVNNIIIFLITSILYFLDAILYVFQVYESAKTSLILYLSAKIGTFFIMLSIMLYRKILEYKKLNNSNKKKDYE
ncbi:hypothetical protein IKP85_00365 [bacterium]|nr:hypothetical protein [bacterium]